MGRGRFRYGEIAGVVIEELKKNVDERGWLVELFRQDEIDEEIYPVMSYISQTLPGQRRGPHVHQEQTDYFCFVGYGNFRLFLWDNRKASPTYWNKMVLTIKEGDLKKVIIPPGVVHGYENIGKKPGLLINFPNRLFKGRGRKRPPDEIRYEERPRHPFTFNV